MQKIYKSGDVILRQGDPGESAYIIESGRVEILVQSENGPLQNLGTRGPGSIIGEMAIVDNAPRTATVRAIEDCTLLEITHEDFARRLKDADPVLRMTTQVILTRYRDTLARSEIRRESKKWPPVEELERSSAGEAAIETVKLQNEFKNALDQRELSLNYQPIIDLQNGTIAGFEALMRWNHPVRGFISPNVFIPIAEQSGLIIDASQWALKESCLALKRLGGRTGHDNDMFMSVNFSSRDFASEDFVQTIYEIISATDLPLHQVHLEITERLLMDQPDNARETLAMCSKAGLGISIDDFGTGYSSLSYLHYFPIDTLKIDRSFVSDMHTQASSMALVKSIITLAKNMNLKVIAEGVEKVEEARELMALGCDMAQGYYFAKPMTEKDTTDFIRKSEKFII
jgi:EAL domain-containing protein (putative c-di-GMP-specific phosphodiesterase class I)